MTKAHEKAFFSRAPLEIVYRTKPDTVIRDALRRLLYRGGQTPCASSQQAAKGQPLLRIRRNFCGISSASPSAFAPPRASEQENSKVWSYDRPLSVSQDISIIRNEFLCVNTRSRFLALLRAQGRQNEKGR